MKHYRFTTNDINGKRQDNIRTKFNDGDGNSYVEGLFWPELDSNDGPCNDVNFPNLYDIAEAEFYLSGDPVTGFDGIDLEESELILTEVDSWASHKETTKEIKSWKLSSLPYGNISDGSFESFKEEKGTIAGEKVGESLSPVRAYTVSFDPAIIRNELSVFTDKDSMEFPGDTPWLLNCVRYEFRFKPVYKYGNKIQEEPQILSKWIFDNHAADGFFNGLSLNDFSQSPVERVELIIDKQGKDVTTDVPLYTYDCDGSKENSQLYPCFCLGDPEKNSRALWDEDLNGSYLSSYMNLCNAGKNTDPDRKSYLGLEAKVRWNTDLSEIRKGNGTVYPFLSEPYDLEFESRHPENSKPLDFSDNGKQYRLYYQIYDEGKGQESPIYVVDLRRDDENPTVEISVSEREKASTSVDVKVTDVYDGHMENGRFITDTASDKIIFAKAAWQELLPGEKFREDDQNYRKKAVLKEGIAPEDYKSSNDLEEIMMKRVPETEDGSYHFTANGFVEILADDTAVATTDMKCEESVNAIVNGGNREKLSPSYLSEEECQRDIWEEFNGRFYVSNIDTEPPVFMTAPKAVSNKDGSLTIETQVDAKDTAAIYLQFDKKYTEALNNTTYSDDKSVPYYKPEEIPGGYELSYDEETGWLKGKIYANPKIKVPIQSVTVQIRDSVENKLDHEVKLTTEVKGVNARILNKNKEGTSMPLYDHAGSLKFNVPVQIPQFGVAGKTEFSYLPIYSDGKVKVTFVDLFGNSAEETIWANIFGTAFKHKREVESGGKPITLDTPTNKDVKVTINLQDSEELEIVGKIGLFRKYSYTADKNGMIEYTLKNKRINQERTFRIQISNIDKTDPIAEIDTHMENDVNPETGKNMVYSITYRLAKFSEDNVTILPDDTGNNSAVKLFDSDSTEKTHTFRFRDAAGNEGSYTVDVSDITFECQKDNEIASYRAIYYGGVNNTRPIWIQTSQDSDCSRQNGYPVNTDVTVVLEALNKDGKIIPAKMTVKDNNSTKDVQVISKYKNVIFKDESKKDRTVTVLLTDAKNNSMEVPLMLKAGSIDTTPPKGLIEMVKLSNGAERAYLKLISVDVLKENISFTGQTQEGLSIIPEFDENRKQWYVDFEQDGAGQFVMEDAAGNVGTVSVGIAGLDNTPPQLKSEGWSGITEATTDTQILELLNMWTNNSIFLFFSFDEQLAQTEVEAYTKKANNDPKNPSVADADISPVADTDTYVTANAAGNTLSVAFKQNCQARISVKDVRGNETVLWRPEYGPITKIDKKAPELEAGYPKKTLEDNCWKYTYRFADDENVMLLTEKGKKEKYKNEHTVELNENGTRTLTFVDEAGNVLTVHPVVSGIDQKGPDITMVYQPDGDGKDMTGYTESIGEDGNTVKNYYGYTTKNVQICLLVDDETKDGLKVTAYPLSAGKNGENSKEKIPVVSEDKVIEAIDQDGNKNRKTYTHHFTVNDNGIYEVSVKDKWGNETVIRPSVNIIDRTGPSLYLEEVKPVVLPIIQNKDELSQAEKDLEEELLKWVTVEDEACGRGKIKDSDSEGTKLSTDISRVNFEQEGSYTADIIAEDALGNQTIRSRAVNVLDVRIFQINEESVVSGETYIADLGMLKVDASNSSFKGEEIILSWMEGFRTKAEMKYADCFDGSLKLEKKGYYTIMAQSNERGMYLIYIYVR